MHRTKLLFILGGSLTHHRTLAPGLTVVAALVVGCATGTEASEDVCGEANAHVAECLGAEVSASVTCDQNEAALILQETCGALHAKLSDQKSDLFDGELARIGCRLGFYYLCETPACDPAADEPVPELGDDPPAGASLCAQQALAYDGCGACDYYQCREQQAQCGASGYLLNFAYRYCNRYRLVSEPKASPAGQAWLRRVRRCLITSLDAQDQSNDCQSIGETGLGSHPGCYVDTGFCDLPISDWILVLNTIEPGDLSFREMFVTGHGCLQEWLSTR